MVGKIITTGPPLDLTRQFGVSGLEVTLSDPNGKVVLKPWEYEIKDKHVHVNTDHPEKDMAEIISQISNQGLQVENVRICRSSLEDVFVKLTGKSLH